MAIYNQNREKTIDNLLNHDIYAENPLLGESLFFTLKMPAHWQLAPGISRPDIVASHKRKHKHWVANGRGWYVVYDSERRWALEMSVNIRLLSNSSETNRSGEVVSINGHTARLAWKTIRRGLPWKRHDVRFMVVDFDCNDSERHLQLEFSGWCPQLGFQEILDSLRYLKCH